MAGVAYDDACDEVSRHPEPSRWWISHLRAALKLPVEVECCGRGNSGQLMPESQIEKKNNKTSPWAWIPSLYLASGLPYVVVMTVSVIMYKGMGVSALRAALSC